MFEISTIDSAQRKAAPNIPSTVDGANVDEETLRKTAREFETMFVAEMLSQAGLDEAIAGDSGIGGEAFSRMIVENYARKITENGGFGLAENIYAQLKEGSGER